jgi:L-aminopeptidase/D-esterase-like protein
VGALRVPIVSGAILFDLFLGDSRVRPGTEAGYDACRCANGTPVAEGNVGAGAGATIGKFGGLDRAMKGGLGSFSLLRSDGLRVGALAAVNPVGNVIDPATGEILAGARKGRGTGFLRPTGPAGLRLLASPDAAVGTVLGVVATNAALTKPQCNKIAQMAQDALARCIDPAHLPWDGDTTFALSTGSWQPVQTELDLGLLGALAAEALAMAILRGARKAVTWGDFPSCRDVRRLPKKKR